MLVKLRQTLKSRNTHSISKKKKLCSLKKNTKNAHEREILLVKLHAEACNFTKSITPPWVFFMFFKLYKWCQIAQNSPNLIFLN